MRIDSADPLEAFNAAMGMDRVRDPYPGWAELRRRGPVQVVDLSDWSPPYCPPGEDPTGYFVLGYEVAAEVLRDAQRFPSSRYQRTADAVMGKNLLSMDPPEHPRYRALVQQGFLRRALAHWESEVVRPLCAHYVERFAGRGAADLARELALPLPAHVVSRLFGLDDVHLARFQRLGVEIQTVLFDFERGVRASRELTALFVDAIDDHRARPREDMLGLLLAAEFEGDRLELEEILGFMRLLLPAGLETTYRALANTLCGLLTHPEQLDALRRQRALLPRALEEGLRWEPPLTNILRYAAVDTQLGGVPIPAGAKVMVGIGAANRDPARYERPDEFDIFRPPIPHLTFGFGPHRCLGMHLALMEMRVAIEALLERAPDVQLDPRARDVHVRGHGFRAPLALPVVFGAEAGTAA